VGKRTNFKVYKIKAKLMIPLLTVLVFAVFPFNNVSYGFSSSTVKMYGGPIRLYIVDLEGIGGFRAANHSAVVEGVIQATFINMEHKLSFGVYISDWLVPDYDVDVYVNATYELVHDWQTYRQLVENANNTIIVNTHDEILPVPDGYAREEWIAVIADFLLQRWGTWVHTGGLPFRIIQYENGTTEEWNDGFKNFMEHANLNVTVKNPPKVNPYEPHVSQIAIEMGYGRTMEYLGWFAVHLGEGADPLTKFWYAIVNYANGFDHCLRYDQSSVDTSIIHIYSFNSSIDLNVYAASAALRLSNKTDSYGVFVYSSPWKFEDGGGNYFSDYNCSVGMGAIPTAAAIWCEAGYAAKKIVEANAAKVRDETAIQKAIDAFSTESYKQSVIYAEKATALSQPNVLPAIILTAVAGAAIATTAIIHRNNKNKKKQGRNECTP